MAPLGAIVNIVAANPNELQPFLHLSIQPTFHVYLKSQQLRCRFQNFLGYLDYHHIPSPDIATS